MDQPSCADIGLANQRYLELLRIASSTSAFSLGDAEAVADRVSFPLSGTESEAPGVITMRTDLDGLDDAFESVTVVFNASPEATSQTVSEAAGSVRRCIRSSRARPMRRSRTRASTTRPARSLCRLGRWRCS